jgi:hypothetical protein
MRAAPFSKHRFLCSEIQPFPQRISGVEGRIWRPERPRRAHSRRFDLPAGWTSRYRDWTLEKLACNTILSKFVFYRRHAKVP